MEAAVSVVHFVFGALCLFVLWHLGIRPYLLDRFREELFIIRDDLFDYAAEGHIDFDDPNYGAVREWLNGSIRLAHRFGPLDTALMSVFGKKVEREHPELKQHKERIERIANGEHGAKLQEVIQTSFVTVGKNAFKKSPLLWVLFPVGFTLAIGYFALKKVSVSTKDILNRVFAHVGRQAETQVNLEEQKTQLAL